MRDSSDRAARVRRTFLRFEIYTDENSALSSEHPEPYRWRLLASNGQLMATSKESYTSREDARRAIVALQASIPVARIVEGPGLVAHRSTS
jgi:uncharacterized protein YegP (UPF0339 family)